MASVTYRLKTNSDWNSIYLRFKQGNKFDYEIKTALRSPKGRWSKSKQEVLPSPMVKSKDLNEKLRNIKSYILKEFEHEKTEGIIISTKWLKEKTALFLNQETSNSEIDDKVFFVSFIDAFIEKSKSRKTRRNKPIDKRTLQHYETTKRKVISLEKKINKRLKLIEIDLDFHSAFLTHLKEDQFLRNSTIGGYVDDVRLFCRTADKKGIKVSRDYRLSDFYSPSYETNDIYLKPYEIKQIYNTNFKNDRLDNARDWFIIGLYTGLRVSDLLKLTKKDIRGNFIYKVTSKTQTPVVLPINPMVREVLNKRKGEFPRRISDQKFNDYIKEVCLITGITEEVEGAKMCPIEVEVDGKTKVINRKMDGKYPKYELVSSHICRRSFATNLYGKLDNFTIMKITGHKSESQFLSYIKVTHKENAERLMEYWNKNMHLFE